MDKAREISLVLGGEILEREDGTWLVLIERPDGRVVAVSDTSVEEYAEIEDLLVGRCYACISLR